MMFIAFIKLHFKKYYIVYEPTHREHCVVKPKYIFILKYTLNMCINIIYM